MCGPLCLNLRLSTCWPFLQIKGMFFCSRDILSLNSEFYTLETKDSFGFIIKSSGVSLDVYRHVHKAFLVNLFFSFGMYVSSDNSIGSLLFLWKEKRNKLIWYLVIWFQTKIGFPQTFISYNKQFTYIHIIGI